MSSRIVLLFLLVSFCSCFRTSDYISMLPLDNNGSAEFCFESTGSPNSINIIVRHTKDYTHGFIPLSIRTTLYDTIHTIDTIYYPLYDNEHWQGKPRGYNSYELELPYRTQVNFAVDTPITLTIQPISSDYYSEIEYLGIRVNNATPLHTTISNGQEQTQEIPRKPNF